MPRSLMFAILGVAALAGPAWAADPSFMLVNRGTSAVRDVFATPAGDANWGQNRLVGRTLAPGAGFLVTRRNDGNCIMDIRVVFADGRAEERKAINTCNIDAVAVGIAPVAASAKPADDPSIRLINRGTQAIDALYATPAGRGNWGQNRLESGPLPPATEKLIRIARTGDCLFDLRVVFADHTAKEKHRSDLCRITDLPVP